MIENKPHKMSSMVVGEGTIQVISVAKDRATQQAMFVSHSLRVFSATCE